eukprot:TRINITY_DN17113_c0_g2_i2.p1 TRINITY_DN17113_c0_g2~~TRINITY_DN17113_c0_g2_i2.p1  ORF type:complete len:283 (+),score=58.43 TRINITY_DN17113_c0_g2_i2:98-850(+)
MLRSLVGSEMCIRDRGDMDALRLVLTLLSFYTAATTPTTYRAAAVEFAPERAPNASISISQARALQLRNLERFVPFIAAAKANHSHIIVFPEYGITGDGTTLEDADFSRDLATIFAEGIPSPDASTSLCGQTAHSKDYPVTRALACMAQKFEIVLAANMLDVVPCTVGRAGCSDGRHQYNTAVVFDQVRLRVRVRVRTRVRTEGLAGRRVRWPLSTTRNIFTARRARHSTRVPTTKPPCSRARSGCGSEF